MSRTRFLHSLSGNAAEKFPPAGGMGDWGLPQQARLSYKCYACVNAASYGDEALCTDLHAPTCQSAGISRKDLNHRPTRVNITANRFSEGGIRGW